MRLFLSIATLATLLVPALPATAQDDILPESMCQRYGLTRAWVTQAQVHRGQGHLETLLLYDGILYAQTSRSTLEAIDAETGQKMWAKLVGQPDWPCLQPGACRDLVATVNGSRLYVLNRYTGDILYETPVVGAPGGGPALSSKRAYVPTVSGVIYAYRLEPLTDPAKELGKLGPSTQDMTDEEKAEAAKQAEEERRQNIRIRQDYIPPLACASNGRALTAPVVTMQNRDEEFVSWTTDKGYMHLGRVDRRSNDALIMKFRMLANGPFNNPPAYQPPDPKVAGDAGKIIAGSTDGNVYCLSEHDGEVQWKFATGDPVIDSPVVIEDRVFVTTELGGLFAINMKTGKQIWWSPEILHFVAAGRQHIYAADKLGRLRILDGKTGTALDILPASTLPIKVCNGQTDRIYLANEGGTIQCLREVEEQKPIVYNQSRKQLADDKEEVAAAPKPKPKSGEPGAHPAPRPVAKKPAKKDDADAFGGVGGDDTEKPAKAGAKPAKPAKTPPAKAGGKAAKPAKGAKEDPADIFK